MRQAMRWMACLAVMLATSVRAEVVGLDYPGFGVSLVGPHGWMGAFSNSKFIIARWVGRQEGSDVVRGLIEIRALPKRGMTLTQFAGTLGREFNAQVVDRSLTVDGVQAWRLEPVRAGDALQVRGAVVIEHEGVLYAVLAAALPDQPWRPALQDVLARWKWIPLESPAKHLRYPDDALALLLHGLVRLPLPVGMGVAEADQGWNDPADSITLGLCNFKKGADDVQITMLLRSRPAGETLEAFRNRLLDELRPRTQSPLAWQEVPERFTRRITPFVQLSASTPVEPVYEQYATIEVDDRRLLLVTFRIMTPSEEDRSTYQRQAEYIFRNLEVTPPRTDAVTN